MTSIRFAADFDLPLDLVTQPCAILARRGWGKTYAATVMAEGMLGAGAQVVAIDPVGVWWGLRLDADGKSPGLQVPVFGGHRGDVEISEHQGAAVAQLLVERGASAVLDVSEFRKAARQRFVGAFCEALFEAKKRERSAIHVFFEEAQLFAPQRTAKGSERLLGAVEDLCRLGRNFGIGYTLISQRPQSVHKDVLNQAEVLIVGQINGPHERKAIEGWVVEQDLDVAEMVRGLPGLQQGRAFLWSPGWLRCAEAIEVLPKLTFDASSTPSVGGHAVAGRELAAIDVDELSAALGVAEKAAEAPDQLRRRIGVLEARLAQRPEIAVERVEVPALTDADREQLAALHDGIESLRHALDSTSAALGRALAATAPSPRPPARAIHATQVPSPPETGNGALPRGERRVLAALLRLGGAATAKRAAFLAGYSPRSSTLRNICSGLRTAGLVDGSATAELVVTPAGRAALPEVEPIPDGDELRAFWLGKVPGGAPRAVFEALLDAYPRGLDRHEIEHRTGYSADSSTMRNAFSTLARLEVITGRGDERRAADELFGGPA